MLIIRAFFVRELLRLRHNIARLENSLSQYPAGSDRADGQRALLAVEQHNREMLLDLSEQAADLVGLELALRLRYGKAHQRHNRATRASAANGHQPGDEWWESLGEMQYLTYLQAQLKALKDRQSPEMLQREIEMATRYKDLGPDMALKELLHAVAHSRHAERLATTILQDDIGMPES